MSGKYILGVADSHNSAAALLCSDGHLSALQEERPKRLKNFSGFPDASIKWLLDEQGISPADVDVLALASLHQPPNRTRDELKAAYRDISSVTSEIKKVLRGTLVFTMKQEAEKRKRIQTFLSYGFKRDQIKFYEHHDCHAATAYYGWGDYSEPILVITCDGAGDGLCATVNIGEHGKLKRLHTIDWEHSIGVLYAVVTYMMGMMPLEHEYKMMGMAPYAKGNDANRIAAKLSGLFEWSADGSPVWNKKKGIPHMWHIKPVLQELFFEERFDAIMAGTQIFTEQMLKEFVRRAIQVTDIHKVALSGGVFMNVKANKEILELEEVDDLFVFPSCGDETNSIGACYLACAEEGREVKGLSGKFYFGPSYNDKSMLDAIHSRKGKCSFNFSKPDDINQAVAELLASGEVVARFAGREEFGARSLGNRAIIADPRNSEVIKLINEMIKNRDFWMPFAASVQDEYADKYLVNPKGVDASYMILSFDSTNEGRELLKAGTHPYDGTCRPQVVTKENNEAYWDLINKFANITGVGGLVNTSLNLHGLPLVHEPEDALYVLENSGLKYLNLGPYLIEKN